MPEFLDEISTRTSVSDVSIISEAFSPRATMNLCRGTMGFVYNTILDKEPMDESYLKNIYFGSLYPSYDNKSSFDIFLDDDYLCLNKNDTLEALNVLKTKKHSDKIFSIKKIAKTDMDGKTIEYKLKNNIIGNPEVILPDVFHIRNMPELKPASIKIEPRSWRNAFYGHRNPGIFFEELPREVFDTLVAYNKNHHMDYKIYAG